MERLPEFIGNHLFLVMLFISILILLLWNVFGSAISGIRQVNPAELTRLINREDAVVVDLRSAEDFSVSHILNAMNIPDADMEKRKNELDKHKEKPLVLYCATGSVSTRIARALGADGFKQVHTLAGGMPSWQNANLPVTKAQ